jgi:hypothetical protein
MQNQTPNQGNNYRVTHLNDPIPYEPALSGYEQISPSYYITSNNTVPPTANDIVIQVGNDVTNPISSNLTTEDQAHDFYFNRISSCYPSACEICIPFM